jgi:23S rRNA (uracil1939-C5)-methyltransferase
MSRRFSTEPVVAVIEKLSHDGRGIARIEGKTTFIEQALPGETVRFTYLRKKRDFDEGSVVEVLQASPQRSEPLCPHYDRCGGCSWQHMDGQTQIAEKQQLMLDLLSRVGHVSPATVLPPLRGPLWHYRTKARLSARYVEKKEACLLGFRERHQPRYITDIDQCPILHPQVDAAIPALRTLLGDFSDLRSIAQVEVAAGDDDVALIFRHLSALTAQDEDKLRRFADDFHFRIFLQPGGNDSVHLFYPQDGQDFLSYTLPEQGLRFQFHPSDFTQVNLDLNRAMVQQALQLLDVQAQDRILDLFCGLGNFSLAMAKHCQAVIGIEGSDAMVKRAAMNAKNNAITNAQFLCYNLENAAVLQAPELAEVTKVLLDPPRVGALDMVQHLHQLKKVQRLVYVSCNPATLARDAGILVNEQGFKLLAAGVMDMFPHTSHVESIALFEREA